MKNIFIIIFLFFQGCVPGLNLTNCSAWPGSVNDISNPGKTKIIMSLSDILNDPIHNLAFFGECDWDFLPVEKNITRTILYPWGQEPEE